jgi:threonine/homoserine/homoserine lactone efflux protein
MPTVALLPLALFCLVASITPGPNNVLLMRSGASFGVRGSTGHMLGIQLGCLALLLLCWMGVGTLLLALPTAFLVMRWACFLYLLWLALVILGEARGVAAAGNGNGAFLPRPMRWYEASAFQLVNPKAWMMAVTMASAFYGSNAPGAPEIAVAAATWVAIGTPSMLVWTLWGATIERVLRRPRERQVYALLMAAAVAATALWMLR